MGVSIHTSQTFKIHLIKKIHITYVWKKKYLVTKKTTNQRKKVLQNSCTFCVTQQYYINEQVVWHTAMRTCIALSTSYSFLNETMQHVPVIVSYMSQRASSHLTTNTIHVWCLLIKN